MQKLSVNSKSDLLKLSLTLFAIAAIMAMLVSLVNNITASEIERRNQQKINDALKAVIQQADSFEEIDYADNKIKSADGKDVGIDGVWNATKDGKSVGVCVKVSPQGYGGKIETIVGINKDGEVENAQIVSISETSGIGTKIQQESFLSQFIGKSGTIKATTSTPAENEVQTISGATKSSSAYLRGINAALTVASNVMEVIRNE